MNIDFRNSKIPVIRLLALLHEYGEGLSNDLQGGLIVTPSTESKMKRAQGNLERFVVQSAGDDI